MVTLRIELPLVALPQVANPVLRDQVVAELRRLGFRFITLDLEGFRSGSLNQLVPLSELQPLSRSEAQG